MSEKEWQEEENRGESPLQQAQEPTQEQLVEMPAEEAPAKEQEKYEYRWSYADQRNFDARQKAEKRKRGAWTYAIVMTAAFLVCFAMLIGVVIWYEVTGRVDRAFGALTVGEVSEIVSPSTVLIYSYQGAGDKNPVSGTGFFIREDGYIATNYHVVEGGTEFDVTIYSAKRFSAKLIGYSEENDLAILKIEGNNYPAVSMGNSDAVKVGDTAIVIGNPNGALGAWTVTEGIISAVDRPGTINGTRHYMLQTDAAINGGNSGGPLCNDRGEVIGVVTQIMLDGNGDRNEGFGLAIPINDAIKVFDEIMKKAD